MFLLFEDKVKLCYKEELEAKEIKVVCWMNQKNPLRD
jgi:hypothetical protein